MTNTPLHIAVQNGNIEIVKVLLASGCDTGARNADGLTSLDLAVTNNNEEIVRLLLEHTERHTNLPTNTHSPAAPSISGTPLPTPFNAEQQKKRITFWAVWCIVVIALFTLIDLIDSSISLVLYTSTTLSQDTLGHTLEYITEDINAWFFCFWIPGVIISLCCYFFFILRLWEAIPVEYARTTPKKAAWLSLIPIFHWYWMFVALGGLYRDMNKVAVSKGFGARFNTPLIIAACIAWLILDAITAIILLAIYELMFFVLPPIIAIWILTILGLSWCIFTTLMLLIIRSDSIEFIDNAIEFVPEKIPAQEVAQKSISSSSYRVTVCAVVFFITAVVGFTILLPSKIETAMVKRDYFEYIEHILLFHEDEKFFQGKENRLSSWERTAHKGLAEGQILLGLSLYKDGLSPYGEEVSRNVIEAARESARWLRKAADQEYDLAYFKLAFLYYHTLRDTEEALRWFRKGAELGCAKSINFIIIIYFVDNGVDKAEAVKWLRIWAEEEESREWALEKLREIEENH